MWWTFTLECITSHLIFVIRDRIAVTPLKSKRFHCADDYYPCVVIPALV